jgi:hypothetical protein
MRKILLAIGLLVIVTGCQKNTSQSVLSNSQNLAGHSTEVDSLKAYLSKLTSIDPSQISYEADTKQFVAFGKNQISFDDITALYNKWPINVKAKGLSTNMVAPPVDPCGDCSGTPPPVTPAPAPTVPPYTNPGDSLLSYSNTLLAYNLTSKTISDDGTMKPFYTDVTQGAVISYSIAVTGSSGGTLSGTTLNVPYNQSQTVKVTVKISLPHDPATGKVSKFTLNATLELFTGNILTPSGIPGYGISITEKNVKPTDIFSTQTFDFTLPVASPSLNGTHFCMYWNNASSGSNEKEIADPVYTIAVQGLPTTSGTTVTEQTGPIIYLYRMFSAPAGEHFYTTSNVEKSQLLNQPHQYFAPSFWSWLFGSQHPNNYWTQEGNIGRVYNYQAKGTVPLYRLYNGTEHMFTINPSERDNIISTLGYHSEGISGYVYSTQVAGSQPIYRYRGTKSAGHFFTTSYTEINDGSAAGFAYEGIAYYDLP